jgi:hypothetical protein
MNGNLKAYFVSEFWFLVLRDMLSNFTNAVKTVVGSTVSASEVANEITTGRGDRLC